MNAFEDFILDLIKITKEGGINPLDDGCSEDVGSSGGSGGLPTGHTRSSSCITSF